MKRVVIVGDGMADEPVGELGGKTPLDAARVPHLDHMAARGILGLTRLQPASLLHAGDLSGLAILGYDVARYGTGCAVFEAAGLGVPLAPGDLPFRLDLVSLARRDDGALVMADFAGGWPSPDEGRALAEDLAAVLDGEGIEVHVGRGHRHLLVWRGGDVALRTVPPHAIADQPVQAALPTGKGADRVRALMERAGDVLRGHRVCEARRSRGEGAPNAVWLWGQGARRELPSLRDRYGVEGAVVAGTALARGIGLAAGLRVMEVPGATGGTDTDYRGKAAHALRALDDVDVVLLHVAAADECGHRGDAAEKVGVLERFDGEVVAPMLDGLRARGGEWRIMVLPGHATPCGRRTHTAEPVPFVIYVAAHEQRAGTAKRGFSEREAREYGIFLPEGHGLLDRLLRV